MCSVMVLFVTADFAAGASLAAVVPSLDRGAVCTDRGQYCIPEPVAMCDLVLAYQTREGE